jgi:hypothetical protein
VVTVVACASAISSASATFASPEAAAHYCEPALDIFEALKLEAAQRVRGEQEARRKPYTLNHWVVGSIPTQCTLGNKGVTNVTRLLLRAQSATSRPLLQPEHDVEEKEKPDQPSDGSALRDASLTGSVHRYEAALPTGYRLR